MHDRSQTSVAFAIRASVRMGGRAVQLHDDAAVYGSEKWNELNRCLLCEADTSAYRLRGGRVEHEYSADAGFTKGNGSIDNPLTGYSAWTVVLVSKEENA